MISQAQLRLFAAVSGVEPQMWVPLDDVYMAPTAEWVLGEFGKWWEKKLKEDGIKYDSNSQDCEDFALGYMFYARRAQYYTTKGASIAVGMAFYIAPGGKHAVNVIYVGGVKTMFVDPQAPTVELVLTEDEKKSVSFIMI